MAEFSYNRRYELVISEPFRELNNVADPFLNTPLENASVVFSGSDDARAINKLRNITITELHIDARIDSNSKSSGSKGSTATIKIYNLSREEREIAEKRNNYIVLNAGYVDSPTFDGIYSGNVINSFSQKQGEDYITTLICKDGYTPSNAVKISYYKERGSTYKDVLEDFAGIWRDNGIGTGQLSLDQPSIVAPVPTISAADTILERGFNFAGKLRKAMDVVCESLGYKWQIVNSLLFVEPKYNNDRIETIQLSQDNILTIANSQEGTRTNSNNLDERGILVTVLLDGRITSSKKLEITDGEKKGTYVINSVSHSISYEGNNWYTTVECSGERNEG